jgi:uncharacterized protein YneF (UPF0154 family)
LLASLIAVLLLVLAIVVFIVGAYVVVREEFGSD